MLNETERYRDTTDGLLDVMLSHVGKTGRCLYTKVKEHSCHDSSEIYNDIFAAEKNSTLERICWN